MKWLMVCLANFLAVVQGQQMPAEMSQLFETLRKDEDGKLTMMARAMLGENGGNKLFYFPTQSAPHTPKRYGREYQDVTFPAADGTQLHGWFIPAAKTAKTLGTVVFSHGNTGALGYHIGFIDWMIDSGYNVMMYDYRGFGKSTGSPSRMGLISDVQAAFAYTSKRADVEGKRLFSFGHSLGGAKSIVALSSAAVPNLRGVMTEGTFASYQGMAFHVAGNFGRNMVTDELAPKDHVAKLPVPLLIIHGSDDEVVPLQQGRQLFAAAVPRKTMFEVKGGHHGDSLSINQGAYRKKVLAWMSKL
jgi:fermentation-respiration switch protein FrsA (DUF1100 family)